MSSAYAIAAVTEALRARLDVEMSQLSELGIEVSASTLPPDRIQTGGEVEPTRLNLFLYHVTPNLGWRNEDLPSLDASGRARKTNPPLALNLHFLLSAYAHSPLFGEVLLGHAMQALHAQPVLTRQAIAQLLPSPPTGADPLQARLAACGLAEQIELIKITPEHLSTEEVSKLWTAFQSHYRPTAAYMASVVLIQATNPVRSPLPVLTRGRPVPETGRDEGIVVRPDLDPPLPTLEAVAPLSGQVVARLGDEIDLTGHHLNGADRAVLLSNDRFQIESSLSVAPPDPDHPENTAGKVRFTIPDDVPDDYPVGVYRVGVRVVPEGEAAARESNRLALIVAPEITGLPGPVRREGRTARFSISFRPGLRAGQRALLVLGEQEYEPQPPPDDHGPPRTSLDFVIENAPEAPAPGLLVRLRIDGIDSAIIDRLSRPPAFLDQRITIT